MLDRQSIINFHGVAFRCCDPVPASSSSPAHLNHPYPHPRSIHTVLTCQFLEHSQDFSCPYHLDMDVPRRATVSYDPASHSPLACFTFPAGEVGAVRGLTPCLVCARTTYQSAVVRDTNPALKASAFSELGCCLDGPGLLAAATSCTLPQAPYFQGGASPQRQGSPSSASTPQLAQ